MYKHGNNVRREIILIPTPLSLGFHITEIRVKSIVAILCVLFQFANSCKKEQCMLFRKKTKQEKLQIVIFQIKNLQKLNYL